MSRSLSFSRLRVQLDEALISTVRVRHIIANRIAPSAHLPLIDAPPGAWRT